MSGLAAAAVPALAAEPALVLAAGSPGGVIDGWARLLAAVLSRGIAERPVIAEAAGGDDGVGGANRFSARAAPDGSTLLLAPGEAAVAWLAGDPRARFDPARWVPVMACQMDGAVFVRADAVMDRPLRVATIRPVGDDLPALLGLELYGWRVAPVTGLPQEAALEALRDGAVDAVTQRGAGFSRRQEIAMALGARVAFRMTADPVVPAGADAALGAAWQAASAAGALECALVLPPLTPAGTVAHWRRAGEFAVASPEVQARGGDGLFPVTAPPARLTGLAADPAALLALRRWLADRLGWQPA